MMQTGEKIHKEMGNAVKWSFLAECMAKLITPFTSMILARILAPEEYGVLAIVTMITSFADMFTDAGFSKFLVQYNFKDEEDLNKSASTAFWTNMGLSVAIYLIIILGAESIAGLFGGFDNKFPIIIASSKLLLTSITSIQKAIYQRKLDYKTIFYVRLICVMIPIVLTIPLALAGLGYWSLIIGILANEAIYALVLSIKSTWKPKLYFSLNRLKRMFSYSVWSLVEQISIWMTAYLDTIIVSVFMGEYYLGLYKQPESMVSSIYSIFVSSVFAILFSALARLKNEGDNEGFWKMFLDTQFGVSILIFPMSVGIFCYREFVTSILLGEQWEAAGTVIGLVALSKGFQLVVNNPMSEVYRATGKPRLSVLAQCIYAVIYGVVLLIGVHRPFDEFIILQTSAVLFFAVIHFAIIKSQYGFGPSRVINNIKIPIIQSALMGVVAFVLANIWKGNFVLECVGIIISIMVYVILLSGFAKTRTVMIKYINNALKRK